MFGSARTVRGTNGLRQLGAVLVAVALALVLAATVALGQFNAAKAPALPAGDHAPIVIDRGAMEGPAVTTPDQKYGGWGGPRSGGTGSSEVTGEFRLGPGLAQPPGYVGTPKVHVGSNGTRFAN